MKFFITNKMVWLLVVDTQCFMRVLRVCLILMDGFYKFLKMSDIQKMSLIGLYVQFIVSLFAVTCC